MRIRLIGIAAVLMMSACVSAPKIDYFTLGMESSGKADAGVNLRVERFRLTQALDRSEIMISTSPTRVDYYAEDHWAGDLGEIVQRKLAAEFSGSATQEHDLIVSGTVLSCEQVDRRGSSHARMSLDVSVRDAQRKRYQEPLLRKTYSAQRALLASEPAEIVEALAECLEEIAAAIAADAASVVVSH